MAEYSEEPTMEVRFIPDASEIDRKLDEIDRRASRGVSFGSEGRPGSSTFQPSVAIRSSDTTERFARSMEAAAAAAARFAVGAHYALGGPDAIRTPGGQFAPASSYYQTGWQQYISQFAAASLPPPAASTYTAAGFRYGRFSEGAAGPGTRLSAVQPGSSGWRMSDDEIADYMNRGGPAGLPPLPPGGPPGGGGWTWGQGGGGGGGGGGPMGGGGAIVPVGVNRVPPGSLPPQFVNIPNAPRAGRDWTFTRSAFISGLFGLWETSRAHQSIERARLEAMLAPTQTAALDATMQGIEGASSGIFGGPISMLLDLGGAGPQRIRETIAIEKSRIADLDAMRIGRFQIRQAGELRNAQILSHSAAVTTQARLDREHTELEINIEREGLTSQIGELTGGKTQVTEEVWNKLSSARGRLTVLDEQKRSAKAQEAHVIELHNREIDLQRLDMESGREQAMLISSTSPVLTRMGLFSRVAGLRALGRSQFLDRDALDRRQQSELRRLQFEAPQLIPDRQAAMTEERNAMKSQQNEEMVRAQIEASIDQQSFNVANKGALKASKQREQFHPFEATLTEMQAQTEIAVLRGQPEDEEKIRALGDQLISEFKVTTERQRDITRIGLKGSIAATTALILHDPLGARLTNLRTERDMALASLPKDTPADIRTKIEQDFDRKEVLTKQQYKEQRYMDTVHMERTERVTALLATAYGPGGSRRRRQAAVMDIVGEASERAEARLFADRNDMANADRERRIGINRLGMMRADYLQGFSAQEGSLQRTAFQGEGTGDPKQVLMDINEGIKQLRNELGHLVAAD